MIIYRTSEELVYQNPWIDVYFDHVQCANPKVTRFTRIVESKGKAGVAILPISEMGYGLVRVFRYPVGRELLEIPRGFGEADSPEVDARRELLEETGISTCELVPLGQVYADSGLLSNPIHLFAATCTLARESSTQIDPEVSRFEWIPRERVMQIARDEIVDAISLATLCRASLHGL